MLICFFMLKQKYRSTKNLSIRDVDYEFSSIRSRNKIKKR